MPKREGKTEPTAKQANGSNFFSSGLRQKVDQLMDILYSGGVNNPMDSIEQLSYLIFLRLLSERDDQAARIEKKYQRVFSGKWARYAWGNFVTLTGNELFDALRGAIETLHELPGLSATGKELFRNATLKIYDRPTLRAIVQGIAEMDLAPHEGHDLKGDMYEHLLSKIAQSGTNGQFRTPRHIIDLIVRLVNPQPGDRICDPACGTAGFLIAAYNHILREHTKPADLGRGIVDGSLLKPREWEFLEEQAFTGFDNDANMVKIAILNLYLHQLEKARIEHFNPLTTTHGGQYPGQRYDVILANPPFAGKIQKESILADINLDSRDTEVLFLKWFLDHLAGKGRAGVIVPSGVLSGSGKADTKLRELLSSVPTLVPSKLRNRAAT
ncbi:MAG: class I SAM-dependent DNA methyltransferase, partial [Candidatus Coatesbacteria bacterium]